ncbi:MAG: MerR family transcriptional regulator [Candidatus Parvibacillus calidus]|nr:MAG: MerR family transcriptional regulator [Candidatus Parvibacillus calidus]
MWEKRYGILQPKRSENNNRYYCQSEVSLLSKIAYLTQNGHKIGKLAKLSREELARMAEDTIYNKPDEEKEDLLIKAILRFDSDTIGDTIYRSMEAAGAYETFINMLLPIAGRLNLLMMAGRIRQSHIGHFFNVVKKIFISEAAKYPPNKSCNTIHLVLYPFRSSTQYISMAAIECGLRQHGIRCTELGQNCPVEDLSEVFISLKPDAFVTVLYEDVATNEFYNIINRMNGFIGNTPLYIVSDEDMKEFPRLPLNVRVFPDVSTLVEYARSLKRD